MSFNFVKYIPQTGGSIGDPNPKVRLKKTTFMFNSAARKKLLGDTTRLVLFYDETNKAIGFKKTESDGYKIRGGGATKKADQVQPVGFLRYIGVQNDINNKYDVVEAPADSGVDFYIKL